jgi:hypothetical protein
MGVEHPDESVLDIVVIERFEDGHCKISHNAMSNERLHYMGHLIQVHADN